VGFWELFAQAGLEPASQVARIYRCEPLAPGDIPIFFKQKILMNLYIISSILVFGEICSVCSRLSVVSQMYGYVVQVHLLAQGMYSH
jgi:hypothetical protein